MTGRRTASLPFFSGILGSLLFCLLTGCAASYHDLDETYINEPFVHKRWLSFLHDGTTTTQEVVDSLGDPTAQFDNGSLFCYRLVLAAEDQDSTVESYRDHFGLNYPWAGKNPTGAFNEGISDHNARRRQAAETGTLWVWRQKESEQTFFRLISREAEYSLVLGFDNNKTLRIHSLRRVLP
jgi:hypothetical protein